MLENLAHAGLWNHFEYWKRALVSLNEKVARDLDNKAFPLWDFNGYFPVATEEVPADSHSAQLKWVYDPSHTNVNTGNRILNIIAGRTAEDFGGRITSSNIDNWLGEQRELRDQFREANPEIVSEIIASVEKARKKSPWIISPIRPSELEINKLTNPKHADK